MNDGIRRDIAFLRLMDLTSNASTVFAVSRAAVPDKALECFIDILASAGAVIKAGR